MLAHGGAIAVMIGWVLSLFATYGNHIILFTIVVPFSHFLLHIYGERNTVWYDNGLIMGLGGALTYMAGATSSIGALTLLFANKDAVNALPIGAALLIFLGSGMITARFFANFFQQNT